MCSAAFDCIRKIHALSRLGHNFKRPRPYDLIVFGLPDGPKSTGIACRSLRSPRRRRDRFGVVSGNP